MARGRIYIHPQASSEPEKLARLERIRTWEHPGAGSFYDDVGNIAEIAARREGDLTTLGLSMGRPAIPEVLWWEGGPAASGLPGWM